MSDKKYSVNYAPVMVNLVLAVPPVAQQPTPVDDARPIPLMSNVAHFDRGNVHRQSSAATKNAATKQSALRSDVPTGHDVSAEHARANFDRPCSISFACANLES